MPYCFDIVHIAGKKNCGPDATSRYPTKTATIHESDDNTHEEITKCVATFAQTQSESLPDALTWEEINEAALVDEECATLKEVIEHGFPEKRGDLPANIRYYWSMGKDLFVIENVTFKGKKCSFQKYSGHGCWMVCMQHTKVSVVCTCMQKNDSSGQD